MSGHDTQSTLMTVHLKRTPYTAHVSCPGFDHRVRLAEEDFEVAQLRVDQDQACACRIQ